MDATDQPAPEVIVMARTTRITGPDGGVTTIQTKSTWGCCSIFAVLLVLAIPAAFFGPFAIVAYIGLGVFFFLGGLGWILQKTGRTTPTQRAPQSPPVPAPPPLGPPRLRHRFGVVFFLGLPGLLFQRRRAAADSYEAPLYRHRSSHRDHPRVPQERGLHRLRRQRRRNRPSSSR